MCPHGKSCPSLTRSLIRHSGWLPFSPSTYQLAAEKGIGVLAFGGSTPEVLKPHIDAYHERVRDAEPVGAVVNDQWCSATLGYCGEDNKEARELAVESIKKFFGPDRPYIQDQKDIYARLLENWGGVPDHLQEDFTRYLELEEPEDKAVDVSGGGAVSYAIWNRMDADTLCDRAVVIGGDPDS